MCQISARILTCPNGSLSPMLLKLLQAFLTSLLNPSVALFHMAIICPLPLMFWIMLSFILLLLATVLLGILVCF